MELAYALFAQADPLFYDKPGAAGLHVGHQFTLKESLDWSSWVSSADASWSFWQPSGCTLPDQGWKIHVSATPATAPSVLEAVSAHCQLHRRAFKFLRGLAVLQRVIGKDADRASAGKFITVYPRSDAELEDTLNALDVQIGGVPGPYILSDLRWKDGPLYVRFGAFAREFVIHDGAEVGAVRDPRDGTLVQDVRTVSFRVPDWVDVPAFLQDQIEALDMSPPGDLPVISRAVHHSNAGGVYEAEVENVPVILKEARPHAGWTSDGRDAIARLHDEEATLRLLEGLAVPRIVGTYEAHGHRFLALEHVEGSPLSDAVVARHPLVRAAPTEEDRLAYRDWALGVSTALGRAVACLHAAGRTHGDLHPRNVMVRGDGSVVLLDLEMSRPTAGRDDFVIGAPGFVPADGRRLVERDLYAVACIDLFLFLPLTPLLALDHEKAAELARTAAFEFTLDETWVRERALVLKHRGARPPARLPERGRALGGADSGYVPALIDEIVRGLRADSTPDRKDRLWPGDPAQFGEPAYSVAHGALGVLASLSAAGREPLCEELAWVDQSLHDNSERLERPGLLDGLAGAVWALRGLGANEQAARALGQLCKYSPVDLGIDLDGGLPGVGLVLLAESYTDQSLLPVVSDIAAALQRTWVSAETPPRVAVGRGGLLHGASGTALFALRLLERTGDLTHLALARSAIEHDLVSLTRAPDGSLQVDEGWRVLPYLGNGSAGVGIVLAQLISHLGDAGPYRETLAGIARTACAPFTVQAGLLNGRAGVVHFLVALELCGLGTAETASALEQHVSNLGLHLMRHADGTRVAGDGLLRRSCDLATGAAGVLGALVAFRDLRAGTAPRWGGLPYLYPDPAVGRASAAPGSQILPKGGDPDGLSSIASGARIPGP